MMSLHFWFIVLFFMYHFAWFLSIKWLKQLISSGRENQLLFSMQDQFSKIVFCTVDMYFPFETISQYNQNRTRAHICLIVPRKAQFMNFAGIYLFFNVIIANSASRRSFFEPGHSLTCLPLLLFLNLAAGNPLFHPSALCFFLFMDHESSLS